VAGIRNIFKPAAGTRPGLACEIRSEGVIAGRASTEKRRAGEIVLAFAPLPENALNPGLKVPNLNDATAVTSALEEALNATSARDRDVALIIPDAAARVLLLDFDTLPPKRQDALPVVRFRLRKMVPFEVDTAAVSYQVMSQKPGRISVLVAVMPIDVRAEYERAVHDAGYEPGAVLPSTLAAAAALSPEGASLLINHGRNSVTTVVTQDKEMVLHRTVDLPPEAAAREEEMAQAVITTLAWYEDTLRATPGRLYYAGPGGERAARESQWLRFVDPAPPIEEVSAPVRISTLTSVPAGLAAGVTGALTQ
jgi:type IV pilus assembly protein PilM